MDKVALSRREIILEKAADLFAHKGYQATGMRELATQVGIEPASIYSHFASKEGLLWEMALACAQDFQRSVEPIAAENRPADRKLHDMIVEHVVVTLRNQALSRIFTEEWRHLSSPRLEEYAGMRQAYERLFRKVLQDGIAEGRLTADDSKFTALTLLSALNFTATWYKPDGPLKPAQIGEQLAELLLNGLLNR